MAKEQPKKIYPPPAIYGLEQLGWTHGNISRWLGVSRQSVSNWGTGRRRCSPVRNLMLETVLYAGIAAVEIDFNRGALEEIEATGEAPPFLRELVKIRMDGAIGALKLQRELNDLLCDDADKAAAFSEQQRLHAEFAKEPKRSPVRLVAGASFFEERPAMQAKGPE